jgi:hypothetical protein
MSDWTLRSTPGRFAFNTSLALSPVALALLLLDKNWKE